MNHEVLTARIPDLMAGNVGRLERWRLNRHLKSCAVCQAEVATYQRIHEDLEITVPGYLQSKSRPSPDFMARVHETIATHPLPVSTDEKKSGRSFVVPRFVVPLATLLLVVVAFILVLTLTSGNGTFALSLETPVKGTLTVTQGSGPVANGTFTYVSPRLWERSTNYPRMPERIADISEISVDGEIATKVGDQPWAITGPGSVDRQPIPGLAELGLTERLFDAVVNKFELERVGRQVFDGEQFIEFAGSDLDYAGRIRDSYLATNGSSEEADELFLFYTDNPPHLQVLTDDDERIRVIISTIQLREVSEPMIVQVVIDEFNVPADIVFPLD